MSVEPAGRGVEGPGDERVRVPDVDPEAALAEMTQAELGSLTARQMRLAAELRKMRECASMTLHEAALRMKVGDPRVARKRLEYILERSELPGVTVRVIPFAAEGFAGMGDFVLYATGPLPRLDTVQIDQVHGSAFLDGEAQLEHCRHRLGAAEQLALSPEESRDFIHQIAREL